MPIGNDEEAARTAQWAQSHKDDPRYPSIVQSLRDYDSTRGARGTAYNPNDTPPPSLDVNPNAKPAAAGRDNSINLGPLATIPELGATILSGAINGPIKELLSASIAMTGNGKGAKDFADNPPAFLDTYTPDDPYAKDILKLVGSVLSPATKALEWLSNPTHSDAPFNQMMEHGSKAVLGAIPLAQAATAEVKAGMAASRQFGKSEPVSGDLLSPDDLKAKFGVDLNSSGQEITKQVAAAAKKTTTGKGSAMEDLQGQIQLESESHKAWTKYLYQLGDEGGGAIRFGSTRKLMNDIGTDLTDYPMESKSGARLLPDVDKITDDLGALFAKGNQKVPLSDVEDIRQRIGKLQRTSSDERSNTALGKIKHRIDDWEDNEVNKAIITGDKETFKVYKQARQSSREWHEMYAPNSENAASNAISKLIDKKADANEIRGFLFGSNAAIGKNYSGNVVKSLNKILGADSPMMQQVRQDTIFDVVKPLLNPNLRGEELGTAVKQFLTKYSESPETNQSLYEQLMPYEKTGLDQLYRVAQTLDKMDLNKNPFMTRPDLVRVPMRFMFGNSLAANNAHIGLATYLIKSAITLVKSPKSAMMKDLYRSNSVPPISVPKGPRMSAVYPIGQSANDSQDNGTP